MDAAYAEAVGRSIVCGAGFVVGLWFAACGGHSVSDTSLVTGHASGGEAGSAGSGGDDTDGTCAAGHAGFGASLGTRAIGPSGDSYDGPAIVERSNAQELFLSVDLLDSDDAAGAPNLGASGHIEIQGRAPLPSFPVGARVWLRKTPAGDPHFALGAPLPPSAFSVYDQQGGKLLLGAASRDQTLVGAPFPIGSLSPLCVGPETVCETGRVTYQSVQVLGDQPVSVADSETKTVRQGGLDYDVRVTARVQTDTADCPQDYEVGDDSGVTVEAQIKDSSLIDALPIADAPSCGEGNAPPTEAFLALNNVPFDSSYDGAVFYAGKDPGGQELLFDVRGLPGQYGMPAQLGVDFSEGLFTVPNAGAEYWASVPNERMASLREAGNGALLLLGASRLSAPFDADTVTQLRAALGVTASAQRRCDYAPATPASPDGETAAQPALPLWDVVFGTSPPTLAKSGERTPLNLQRKPFYAWVWGEGTVRLAIYARDLDR